MFFLKWQPDSRFPARKSLCICRVAGCPPGNAKKTEAKPGEKKKDICQVDWLPSCHFFFLSFFLSFFFFFFCSSSFFLHLYLFSAYRHNRVGNDVANVFGLLQGLERHAGHPAVFQKCRATAVARVDGGIDLQRQLVVNDNDDEVSAILD